MHTHLLRDALMTLALLAAGCSESAQVAPDPARPGLKIPIEVRKPDGPGPFPAVVVLHSCAGMRGGTQRDWAKRLVNLGYLAALPDSFTSRGYPNGVCDNGLKVPATTRALDAYATLTYLEGRPDVIPERVGVTGYSHGGWTVIAVMSEPEATQYEAAEHAHHKFRAAIAFYPYCAGFPRTSSAYHSSGPLLILAGALDDWRPPAPCEELAKGAQHDGQPVSIKVYPGAMHAFDSYLPPRFVAVARQGKGAMIGGNPAAREDSIRQVEAFFGNYLKGEGVGTPSGK